MVSDTAPNATQATATLATGAVTAMEATTAGSNPALVSKVR